MSSTAVTDRPAGQTNAQPPIFDQIIARARAQFPAQNQSPDQQLTTPEQTDVRAWQEIERERGLGKSDKDIWFDAVRNGNLQVVGAFIRKPPAGFDINQKDGTGETALNSAVITNGLRNNVDMVKLLVNDGRIDMASLDNSGTSAYSIAAQYPKSDDMRQIADFLKGKLNGEAAAAYRNGDDKRLDALYAAGADKVDPAKDAANVNKEWFDAVKNADYDKMRQFIHDKPKGWDINAKDARGQTALELAVRGWTAGDPMQMTKFLIDEGRVDMAALGDDGRSALQLGKSLIEGAGGGGAYKGAVDYLQKAMDGEAVAANENGDDNRLAGLVKAGAKRPPDLPGKPPTADTVRPEGDNRNAQQIIKDSPLLANLSAGDKAKLKEKVPDYETNVDAAYRAARVLDFIEDNGQKGQAFDNADLIGNGRIDGFDKAAGGKAASGTEAGRLQDFFKHGFDQLKNYTVNIKDYVDGYKFADNLQQEAYNKLISDAKLPADRKDVLDHPEKYSVQQRYAARLELTLAKGKIESGIKDYNEKGVYYAGSSNEQNPTPDSLKGLIQLNTDPKKVIAQLDDGIKKLTSDDVDKYQADHEVQAIQGILAGDPGRAAKAKDLYVDIKKNAIGLDKYVGSGKDTLEGMRKYLSSATSLNEALGKDGKPLDDDFTINLDKNSPEFQKIAESYKTDLQDPEVLTKLIKDKGLSETDAIAELQSRAVLFATYGANPDDINTSIQENITNYTLNGVTPTDFKGSGFINDQGEVDEGFVNATLDKLRKDNPDAEIFKDENGHSVSNGQILTAVRGGWDAFRNASKVNAATGKAAIPNLKQFFDKDSGLQKTFGTGLMHGVSSMLAAGASIARSETGQKLPLDAKIAAAGNGIQAFGVAVQGFEFTQRTDPKVIQKLWGIPTGPDKGKQREGAPSPRNVKTKLVGTNVMNFGKVLNGSGGAMAGAAGIALGIKALKSGDKEGAALLLTQGISNTLTALGPLAEASAPGAAKLLKLNYGDIAAGRLFVGIGTASLVLNIVAGAAVVVSVIVDEAKNGKRRDAYFDSFTPTLTSYNITGGPDPYWAAENKNVPFPV